MVESIYTAALRAEGDWLRTAFDVMGPYLDVGLGAIAYECEVRDGTVWVSPVERMVGDPALARIVGALHDLAGGGLLSSVYGAPSVHTLNDFLGQPIRDFPPTAEFARTLRCENSLAVRAVDGDGRGVIFTAPLPTRDRIGVAARTRWMLLAGHLCAASRLFRARVASAAPIGEVDASTGRVELADHAGANAVALAGAARRISKARSSLRRSSSDRALSIWQVLASGRWSLVASFGSHDVRSYLVYENGLDVRDPRTLTRRQRTIAQLAAFGHANKLIAYELGCADSTVSDQLTVIRRKLRVRSRAELVKLVASLAAAPADTFEVGGQRLALGTAAPATTAPSRPAGPGLTSAEREVAALAVEGRSNAEIAASRSTSVRTIANQLASVYAKLGVQSRADLATKLASRGP